MSTNLLCALLLISMTAAYDSGNGCVAQYGMDYQCPLSMRSEIMILVGTQPGSKSDNLHLQIHYYDQFGNLLGQFKFDDRSCNDHQSGKTDIMKICASWMPKVYWIKLAATKSDGAAIQTATVTHGNNIQIKHKFWLDNPVDGNYLPEGWDAYSEFEFKCFEKIGGEL